MIGPQGNKKSLGGIIGYFDTPDELVTAMKDVRDARYERFDAFTPFPVHGLDAAQGLRRSPIPYITFIAGLTGGSLGFLLQYWTSAVDWPLIVAGKPFNSWPAFIPVTFELTILFAGLATAGAMLAFNGLPNHRRKAFDPGLTRDKFAIVIESPEVESKAPGRFKRFEESEVADFLRKLGAKDVAPVYHEAWF
ncbi:MAG: DUF3341 domain-containing protein [Oligoflexia bacterium]|nr:DUF3341 domain-containing protein [Oligoflexia bacterium]